MQLIPSPIVGYPALMTAIYNTIDLSLFLESSLMPDASMSDTNATEQAALLTTNNLSPVSVADVSNISLTTANSVVLSMAKVIVDSRYRVKVNNSNLINQTWTGNFIVTNYSDEEDYAISSTISVEINDDYERFIKQKLDRTIKEKNTDDLSITGLFELDYDVFCQELKKYSLNCLTSFHDACQACIDILIEQGIGNSETWSGSDPNLYDDLYMPYYQKLIAIENELKIRQNEISLIEGTYDTDGVLMQAGLQTLFDDIRNNIQEQLNFQNYIGSGLWLEFCAYRREDKYSNDNYISDGLSNSELFEKALEFHKVAKNEIYKSAKNSNVSIGIITNITQDHLEDGHDFNKYISKIKSETDSYFNQVVFSNKIELETEYKSELSIPYGLEMIDGISLPNPVNKTLYTDIRSWNLSKDGIFLIKADSNDIESKELDYFNIETDSPNRYDYE